MKPKETGRANNYKNQITDFSAEVCHLPGVQSDNALDCLAWQLVDSVRRIEYCQHVAISAHHPDRMNPHSDLFDPLKAAVLQNRQGNSDEAYWLVFLATHFGKHHLDGWLLVKDVYGKLGGPGLWSWDQIIQNPESFRTWLAANQTNLQNRRFSNHRKFESLKAHSSRGTADVFESYVKWVSPPRTHQAMIQHAHLQVGQNPKDCFNYLYKSMKTVKRFGRLGRFDLLTMLGKLGISPIEPDSAYLWHNATGPLLGARLLFGTQRNGAVFSARTLDTKLLNLDAHLNVGMQALEDALCNWQKSPRAFRSFRG